MQTTDSKRKVAIAIRCVCCKQYKGIHINEEDYKEYRRPYRRPIQDIFPYLSAEEREMLLSKICPDCWNNAFGDEEE